MLGTEHTQTADYVELYLVLIGSFINYFHL